LTVCCPVKQSRREIQKRLAKLPAGKATTDLREQRHELERQEDQVTQCRLKAANDARRRLTLLAMGNSFLLFVLAILAGYGWSRSNENKPVPVQASLPVEERNPHAG